MSELVERVKMCLAEAGFVEGRDYGGLDAVEDDPTGVHLWGWHYLHPPDDLVPALRRAVDISADPKERRAV